MKGPEIKVAPNIYKTPYGWRVYVRRHDPTTGRSAKKPIRFKPDVTLEELEYFRDSYKLESKKLRREARQDSAAAAAAVKGTFAEDAKTYLELATTKAMPSYVDQAWHINAWVAVFGNRKRAAITTREIDEQLQKWHNEGYAGSSVNRRRTALMALWTTLDGRGAANPVREARMFPESDVEPRGLPYELVVRILDAVPATRSWSHLRKSKTRPVKTRIRLEVMAWTGMRPSQIMRLERKHVNFEDGWFVSPRSKKGKATKARPQVRKPMTADAATALRRFFECGCEGRFSTSSVRRIFLIAVRAVEKAMRKERKDPTFRLPAIRPYDLRHSFGTEMLRRTKNLETVAELLDHSSTKMTKRYALGAMTDVLRAATSAFEASTTNGKRRLDLTPTRPKAPRARTRRQAAEGYRFGGTRQPVTV